jgi:hypothetical protein
VLILAAVVLAVVVAGILVVRGGARQTADPPSQPTTQPTSQPTTQPSSPLPSASASTVAPDPTPRTTPPDSRAATVLKGCRAKVRAGDDVMAAAKTGMGNWSDHVQAQTDANSGKITAREMDDIFSRTMKAGDEDEQRYTEAVEKHDDQDGSCRAVAGATAEVTKQLKRCAERGRADRPVLEAADAGMADWSKHLGEMRRSMKSKIHNAQQTWLRTWRAAPPHIKAYQKAAKQFSAPDC